MAGETFRRGVQSVGMVVLRHDVRVAGGDDDEPSLRMRVEVHQDPFVARSTGKRYGLVAPATQLRVTNLGRHRHIVDESGGNNGQKLVNMFTQKYPKVTPFPSACQSLTSHVLIRDVGKVQAQPFGSST